MKKNKTLDRSLEWIRTHPGAVNLDVPDDLVAAWIFNDDRDDPKPNGFFLSVFTFGFLQQELIGRDLASGEKLSVPCAKLLAHFDRWQVKLGLVVIHRKTDISVAPLPLFSFPPGEEIKYVAKATSGGGTAS